MIPIIDTLLLLITVSGCAFVAFRMKRENSLLEARYLQRGEEFRMQVVEFNEHLAALRRELAALDRKAQPPAMGRTVAPGIRLQAIRRIRNGERGEQIALDLGLTRGEVELLTKVQQRSPGAGQTAGPPASN